MSLPTILNEFIAACAQCDSLIANSHGNDSSGAPFLPQLDREQITVAAFLNVFVAWETFLEASLLSLMTGNPTISGNLPTRYVQPRDEPHARQLLISVNRFFDFGNQEYVRKIVSLYFQNGYPFEPHLGAIYSDLSDLRTMRNASAHITSTTQSALESLALRIFGSPRPAIRLYDLLTSAHPASSSGATVFIEYKLRLETVAGLIAHG